MFSLIPRFETLNRNLFPDIFSDEFFVRPLTAFKTDIKETENGYVVEAELPGYTKDEISVEYDNGELTVSAKKDEVNEDKNENYIRKERRFGSLARTFVFDNVNGDEIKAEFKDGVLKLNLPKLEAAETKVKKIDIN